jgi:hypothetical protein
LTLRMFSSQLHYNRFTVLRILTWYLCMTNVCDQWFQRTSRLSSRPVGGMWVLIFCTALRVARIIHSRYHRQWFMGLRVQPWYKLPQSAVAHCTFTILRKRQFQSMLMFWQWGDRLHGVFVRTNS